MRAKNIITLYVIRDPSGSIVGELAQSPDEAWTNFILSSVTSPLNPRNRARGREYDLDDVRMALKCLVDLQEEGYGLDYIVYTSTTEIPKDEGF